MKMHFYAILCYLVHPYLYNLKCYIKIIGDPPVVSNKHKLLAAFHSGTLSSMDTVRLMFFF